MKELFVLVFGSSIDGTVLYGPFNTPGEVHDANRQLALPFYTVGSISIDEYNQQAEDPFSNNKQLFTVAKGNPFDKMSLVGLFDDICIASDYGLDNFVLSKQDNKKNYFVVPLKNLEKVLEEIKQSSGLPAGY
jgi:hypothetical protein